MKIFFQILATLCILLYLHTFSWALDLGGVFQDNSPEIHYCDDDGECGIKQGIEELQNIDDLVTNQPASEYIQNVVVFLLRFLALVGVVYIIYAGFNILTGAGDEDKVNKSKTTIIYVIIGVVIIFFAAPIMNFILEVLNGAKTP